MTDKRHKELKKIINSALISGAAIILSLLIAAVIMAAGGYDPLKAYAALFEGSFGSFNAIANTLSKSIPLLFAGLSFAFAIKGGMFNIGGEGQLYMGAFLSAVTAIAMDGMSRWIVIPAAILAGMAGGAAVGGIIGVLKAKLNINEVIAAIMMNYIALYVTSYFVNNVVKEEGSMTAQTIAIQEGYMFRKLIPRTQLTTALFLGVTAAVLLYYFFKKTRLGYHIRAVGENGMAARAAGVSMVSLTVVTLAASGAIAGLAGVTEVLGKSGRFIDNFSPGYGFTGIAVAVLGNNNPCSILFSALLFGILEAGSMKMSYSAGISSNMVKVIQGLVILFVATPGIIRAIGGLKRRKK